MSKSSTDYAEIAGLKLALNHLIANPEPNTQIVIDWIKLRIAELEKKQ
jgi:hypothetical protein